MDNEKCSMDKNTHSIYHLFNLTHKLLEGLPFFSCMYVLRTQGCDKDFCNATLSEPEHPTPCHLISHT